MRVNIGETTFNMEVAPKNFGSRTSLKIPECRYCQCKKKKLLLSPWN